MHNLLRLLRIMAILRDPQDGCPWDKAQTFETIPPHTLEEAYEVMDAVEQGDLIALKDELGDLLYQIVFYAQLASERDLFGFNDIAEAICDKLIRRHPHVFSSVELNSDSLRSIAWEEQKTRERVAASKPGEALGVLTGIPKVLPELLRAYKLQKRAAHVGFDWPNVEGVYGKIAEELAEVRETLEDNQSEERVQEEIGDLLFSVVNLARHCAINPEYALRQANQKFMLRFQGIEKKLHAKGLRPEDCSLLELDALWNEVKQEIKH